MSRFPDLCVQDLRRSVGCSFMYVSRSPGLHDKNKQLQTLLVSRYFWYISDKGNNWYFLFNYGSVNIFYEISISNNSVSFLAFAPDKINF